ncbi:MAG: hypothetical protein O2955_21295 [Planctomycetota bacterium]|nr:hypothetical protein [Planctomycetota bacterium]MDA1215045.1 hypothetical protein [Planctomycetota bacterium]
MNPLVVAIDELIEFLKPNAADDATMRILFPARMPECDRTRDRFDELDERVYTLAYEAGLLSKLPTAKGLAEAWTHPTEDTAEYFYGRTSLPGSWMGHTFAYYHYFDRGLWREAMLALRSAAGAGENNLPVERVVVDLARKTITLDGIAFDCTSERALRWVKVLADRPGEWFAAGDLTAHDAELMDVRTDRLRKFLPSKILDLIESQTGAGSRLKA